MTYKTGEVPQVGDSVTLEGVVQEVSATVIRIRVGCAENVNCELWYYTNTFDLLARHEPPCVTFEQALAAYKQGKKVRRKDWGKPWFLCKDSNQKQTLTVSDIEANNWQIFEPEGKQER